MLGRLTPARVHSGCCTGAKISFRLEISRWAGTGSTCVLFLIDAIFAIWIHPCMLSICCVPSSKHDTNSLRHHVKRYQEVTSVWNSRRCEFSHVNTPSERLSVLEIVFRPKYWRFAVNTHYYQYARPNDKLPSVKRVFLQAKWEMCGLKIHLPPWYWLAAEMSNNFARPMRREFSWMSLHLLALYWALQWTFKMFGDLILKRKKSQLFSFF